VSQKHAATSHAQPLLHLSQHACTHPAQLPDHSDHCSMFIQCQRVYNTSLHTSCATALCSMPLNARHACSYIAHANHSLSSQIYSPSTPSCATTLCSMPQGPT
jgi:hypothetical protein